MLIIIITRNIILVISIPASFKRGLTEARHTTKSVKFSRITRLELRRVETYLPYPARTIRVGDKRLNKMCQRGYVCHWRRI